MPQDLRDAEELAQISDPTARMIRAYQLKLNEQKRGQPLSRDRPPRWM